MEMQFEVETAIAAPKDYNYYKAKETQLNRLLNIVQERLKWYQSEADKIQGAWTEADQERFKNWNDWHDKEYKFKQMLWDNYSNYQTYCFETHGISVIDF